MDLFCYCKYNFNVLTVNVSYHYFFLAIFLRSLNREFNSIIIRPYFESIVKLGWLQCSILNSVDKKFNYDCEFG